MSAPTVLLELKRMGVRLDVNGDRLRVDAPKGTLTPELLERVRACKPDLIRLVTDSDDGGPADADLSQFVKAELDDLDRRVIDDLDGPDPPTPIREAKRSASTGTTPPTRYEIPDGWDRASWIWRLRYLASVCILPARARELAEWADGLERGFRDFH